MHDFHAFATCRWPLVFLNRAKAVCHTETDLSMDVRAVYISAGGAGNQVSAVKYRPQAPPGATKSSPPNTVVTTVISYISRERGARVRASTVRHVTPGVENKQGIFGVFLEHTIYCCYCCWYYDSAPIPDTVKAFHFGYGDVRSLAKEQKWAYVFSGFRTPPQDERVVQGDSAWGAARYMFLLIAELVSRARARGMNRTRGR